MAGFAVRYDQAQFRRLQNKFSQTEVKQIIHQTTQEVTEFLQAKMQEAPPQKAVMRQQAFGTTFFTTKQRRWFFGALKRGELTIPYRRTGKLAANWRIQKQGAMRLLTNETPYVGYVQERNVQSRMMKIIGWRTVSYYLQRYSSEVGRVGIMNIKRWWRK